MPNNVAAAAPAPAQAGEPPFFELSRLMVVAIDASTSMVNYRAQTAPNGPWESGWTAIDTTHKYSAIAAGLTRDGRVAVVGQSVGGGVIYIDESLDQPGNWNAAVDLGQPGGKVVQNISTERDADGRVEIFAVATDGSIWWMYQNPDQIVDKQVTVTPPGTTTPIVITVQELAPPATPWSQWAQIPGGLATILARRQGDGRINLFGINAGAHLYRCVQAVANATTVGDWSQWVQIDDNSTGLIAQTAAIVGPGGSLDLFALTTAGQVVHTLQQPAGTDNWTAWTGIGFSRTGFTALGASLDGDGHVALVASDKAKVHSFNVETDSAAQAWSGWNDFAVTDYPVQLAIDYNADGRLSLFSHWLLPASVGVGGMWTIAQARLDSTEWEVAWTQLAPSNIQQFCVVRDLTPPT